MSSQLINPKHLAWRWGLSPRTLERWRSRHQGPAYVKLVGRVMYRLEDIQHYEEQRLRQPRQLPSLGRMPVSSGDRVRRVRVCAGT